MQFLAIIILVGCLAVAPVTTNGASQCPIGCYCNKQFVDCSALMEFPIDLPLDTVRFRTSLMNIQSVPPKAFSYLPNLTIVEFTQSNIHSIHSCAFTSAPSLQKIVFEKAVVGNVESYAFNGLSNLEQIEFANSRIGRLKPFGFYNLTKITSFNIVNTNLTNFYSHALCNLSDIGIFNFKENNVSDMVTGAITHVHDVNSVFIVGNKFWNMHCGVLDTLISIGATAKSLAMESNTFYCNCSISHLVNHVGHSKYHVFLPKSKCHGPDAMVNASSLAHVPFGDLKCAATMNIETIITCPEVPLNPDPQCVVYPNKPTSPDAGGEMSQDDNNAKNGRRGSGVRANGNGDNIILALAFLTLASAGVLA
ncbi:leucine-rich repeat-containing protein 4B-like [Dreissena polymorpha]|uniref:leucine-rich repeat-containing protein 4B-like n=1 Tax=Dreissena polymorpha TaxID=45954 RepID=UPI002264945A|nr:leucine-rich repeat-containing protein 4B-like [Dreissena polymorpha]